VSDFIQIPSDRLDFAVLQSLLEEFASRDGTDYGEKEATLEEKVAQLRLQLQRGTIVLLFDTSTETWDLLEMEQAQALIQE
jgi:uncharacterized protein YheU (UPF0270 family)